MPPRARPPNQWDLVTESFSEAAFLWARWEDAMESPRHTLGDVVYWVEERLLGALDGVRLGGQRAVEELLIPALTARRTRPATIAAHLLTQVGRAGIERVVATMLDAAPERLVALRRGVECSAGAQWPSIFSEFVGRLPPAAQATVLDAFAFRRWPAPPGTDAQVDRTAKPVQLASLRLAAVTRDAWTLPYIEWGLQRSDPLLKIEAARAAALRGHAPAMAHVGELVRTKTPGSDVLLPLAVLDRGARLLPMLQARLLEGKVGRHVFDALACVGTIEAADVCASLLDHADHGRLAADGLRAITGLDPTPPYDAGVVAAEGPRDELLLPTPAPEVLRAAWTELRPHYETKVRYLGGRPFDPATLADALSRAPMRRRHLLAAELAMRTGGAAQIVTATWTRLQRGQIDALQANAGRPS